MKNIVVRTPIALALILLCASAAFAMNEARVRVVHASPDAPGVDIVVNDSLRPFTDVEFGDISDYAEVTASVYNVKVTPAGLAPESAVIEADLSLYYNADYTVVAVDFLDNITPIVLLDDNSNPPLRQSRLRFVHASPDAPPVDIKVLDGPYLYQNVAFTEVGDYLAIPEGIYTLQVLVAGTDAVALEVPGLFFRRGRTYTAFAAGLVGGTPGLTVLLSEDARGFSAASFLSRFRRGDG
jgi:hypothetical protein